MRSKENTSEETFRILLFPGTMPIGQTLWGVFTALRVYLHQRTKLSYCLNKTEGEILLWQIFVLSVASAVKSSKQAFYVNILIQYCAKVMQMQFCEQFFSDISQVLLFERQRHFPALRWVVFCLLFINDIFTLNSFYSVSLTSQRYDM